MATQAGQCSKCRALNNYAAVNCMECGTRLPWANAIQAAAGQSQQQGQQGDWINATFQQSQPIQPVQQPHQPMPPGAQKQVPMPPPPPGWVAPKAAAPKGFMDGMNGPVGILVALGAVAVIIFMLAIIPSAVNDASTLSPAEFASGRSSLSSGGDIVTMAHFNQIQIGMTYEQVAQIIGNPGSQTGHQEMMGITHTSYSWQNPGGPNMLCMFQDGKLINKSQFGLR